MVRIDDTLWCDGCGVEILWAPVIYDRRYFCCEVCCRGEECDCAQRLEEDDQRRESPFSTDSIT